MISTLHRLLPAALLSLHLGVAYAQLPAELVERPPAQLASDAFASDYGLLIVAEFGRILRASAGADCLRARNIDPASLGARGRDILVRHGARILDIRTQLIDTGKFEIAFAARAGHDAKAEFLRLRSDPDVRKFTELHQPAYLAGVVLETVELVDRHALLARIRLSRHLSPLATGDPDFLNADPADKSAEAVERFVKENKSPRLQRWIELGVAFGEAVKESVDRQAAYRLGPRQLTEGLDADLAALCIPVG